MSRPAQGEPARLAAAPRSGAQPGNTNALKHGFYTGEAIAERRRLRGLLRGLARSLEGMG